MVFKLKDRDELLIAVNLYIENKEKVIGLCGNINTWDVSSVEDMSNLFFNQTDFNEDISSWDTSNVKYMAYMFKNAESFNQP